MATVTQERKRKGPPKRKPRPVDLVIAKEHLSNDIQRSQKTNLRLWTKRLRTKTQRIVAPVTRAHESRRTRVTDIPILVEHKCPECGSANQKIIQRPPKRKPAKEANNRQPRMDIPTRWVDIEAYRNKICPRHPFVPYCLGGARHPQNQLGIDLSGWGRQREILLYTIKQYYESEFLGFFDFFEMMSDALLRNNIVVSAFVLRHLCQIHIDREAMMAEDREYIQNMPNDVKAYLVEEGVRHMLVSFAKRENKVVCPECCKVWKQKKLNKQKDGKKQIWTHQRKVFGRTLRSDEVWEVCPKCAEQHENPIPEESMYRPMSKTTRERRAMYRRRVEELLADKDTDTIERFVEETMVRMNGAIVCGDCGTHITYEYGYEYRYFDTYNQDRDTTVIMAREAKAKLNPQEKKDKKKEVKRCDVCGRTFYNPQGATGIICEDCVATGR